MLGLSKGQVVWHAERGRMGAHRDDRGRWWFDADEVEAFRAHREAERGWISIDDAADLARCSRPRVKAAVERGEIVGRQVARNRPSLDRTSVEAFAARHAVATAEREQWARELEAKRRRREHGPDDGHTYLAVRGAARLLGRSADAVRELARAEQIPAVMVEGRWWFRADHLELWVRARNFEG